MLGCLSHKHFRDSIKFWLGSGILGKIEDTAFAAIRHIYLNALKHMQKSHQVEPPFGR